MLRAANRWFEENRWAGDAIIAAAVLVVVTGVTLSVFRTRGSGPAMLFSLLLVLPLFARRTYPLAVLGTTFVLCLLQIAATASPVPGDAVVPIVIHAAAAYIPDRRWGYGALVAGVVGAAAAAVLWSGFYYERSPEQVFVMFLGGVAVIGAAYLWGIRHRERRERADEQLAALTERNRLLIAERDTRAAVGAAAERARIARELHDIVAHSLSVIVVQADGGAAAARTRPEIGPQVLETIADTSRSALAQMRRMVSVLRGGHAGPGADAADYLPAPGPGDLADLVAQVRSTGLPVVLETIGTPREVASDVGLAVYRTVQESLTNVLKHAGPAASCRVVLHYGAAEILITVTDDGRGAAASGGSGRGDTASFTRPDNGGHGLAGMRERVDLHGGTMRAGPKVGGGFEVTVTLPYRPGRAP